MRYDEYEPDEWDERVEMFADPGGHSALRRASRSNPRNQPCPNCGTANVLTPADVQQGYQCDRCADAAEGLGWPS
jgi:ribosomal protein S27AE